MRVSAVGQGKVGWQSAGVRIGGRELGALGGVWSRIFVLEEIGAYLRVVCERMLANRLAVIWRTNAPLLVFLSALAAAGAPLLLAELL